MPGSLGQMKWWVAIVLALAVLVGCGAPADSAKSGPSGGTEKLTIALVPSEDQEKMLAGFEPIRAHLAKELGREVEVITVTDYAGAVEAMRAEKVDIAWFGPLSYILAHREAGAEAFAIGNDTKKGPQYHSLMVVPANSPALQVEDLAGKRAAFVDPGSTSGYLIPRSAIEEITGQDPEKFFQSVVFAGGHDAALLALKSGSVDVAMIQDVTFDDMSEKGLIDPAQFRILRKSDPIPGSPLAVRKSLDAETKTKIAKLITEAHLSGIKMEVPGQGVFDKFLAVDHSKYQPIEAMVDRLKLTRDQMAK